MTQEIEYPIPHSDNVTHQTMKLTQIPIVFAASFAILATASHNHRAVQCAVQCCQNVGDASSEPAATILRRLGIAAPNVRVGITCTPSQGGQPCSGALVCCDNVQYSMRINMPFGVALTIS